MIYGLMHPGSGLGNQLHRYVATRVLALDKGYDFSMVNRDDFKGKSFMKLDMGLEDSLGTKIEYPSGKVTVIFDYPDFPNIPLWEEWDKHTYDPDFNFVEDNTIIDGNFEDERYFIDHIEDIKDWLKTEPVEMTDDVCVIGFRGGEYYTVPELGLPREWYIEAIKEMAKINPNMHFVIATDDEKLARVMFPGIDIVEGGVGNDWQAVRYAKYAIIANSSFYVLPRLLSGGITIAPRYWNRYNIKKWDYPQGYYKSFKYI